MPGMFGGIEWLRFRMTRLFGRTREILTLAVVVGAQWLLGLASVLSVLLVPVLLWGLWWARRNTLWGSAAVMVLLNPLTLPFAVGVAAWHRDGSHMMSVGLQQSSSSFVHHATRLPVATSGCVVSGNEWVAQLPYNAAIKLMTYAFGPPRGTYQGPIPTEETARATLAEAGMVTDWRSLSRDRVTVGGRDIQLQQWLGPALLDACYAFDPFSAESNPSRAPEPGTIRVATWKNQVLLIELKDAWSLIGDGGVSHVAVVDLESGRVFGHFEGARCRGLPLPWQPVGPRPLDMDLRSVPTLLPVR